MSNNDLVEEVRKVRQAHAEEFGFDLDRIVEDIRRGEKRLRESGWKLVRRRAKKSALADGN
jgi:hypothetical protein